MRILYLGTDPSRYVHTGELVHYPVIRTTPLAVTEEVQKKALECSHWLFTSPNAVRHWFSQVPLEKKGIDFFAVGSATALALSEWGIVAHIAPVATQEGMIEKLESLDLRAATLFWPKSSIARSVLADYILARKIPLVSIDLYETIFQNPDPALNPWVFDEIVFTSPSTVEAFLTIFGRIPWDRKIVALGPITQMRLQKEEISS